MLSIVTPTYNRSHLLNAAYQSLLRQDNKNFEWIVIDDGSTDNTEALCRAWGEEGKIKIVYERQENGGVNRARNRGIELAQGELVLGLDDDDYLSDDAISTIDHYYQTVRDKPKIGCLTFLNGHQKTGKIIGRPFDENVSTNNYIRLYYWERYPGDLTGAVKTEVLKKYPFPAFDGEKYAPEAISFIKIAKEYDLLCVNKVIKFVEYLENGMTRTGHPESRIITGLLSYNYEKTEMAFPYRVRKSAMRKWIRLKLQTKASWISVFRETKYFWLCCACFPSALLQFLCRINIGRCGIFVKVMGCDLIQWSFRS